MRVKRLYTFILGFVISTKHTHKSDTDYHFMAQTHIQVNFSEYGSSAVCISGCNIVCVFASET